MGCSHFDDLKLFDFLTLETFQAGLSWITILRKREHFRKAFDQFDYEKVARYGDEKINTLLNNQSSGKQRPTFYWHTPRTRNLFPIHLGFCQRKIPSKQF